jgi:hypothetical protein
MHSVLLSRAGEYHVVETDGAVMPKRQFDRQISTTLRLKGDSLSNRVTIEITMN